MSLVEGLKEVEVGPPKIIEKKVQEVVSSKKGTAPSEMKKGSYSVKTINNELKVTKVSKIPVPIGRIIQKTNTKCVHGSINSKGKTRNTVAI